MEWRGECGMRENVFFSGGLFVFWEQTQRVADGDGIGVCMCG